MSSTLAVVGPGAIGTTIAAALHEADRTPLLCGRTPRECLVLCDDGKRIVVPGPVLLDPARIESTVDIVFLAVKATQLDASAAWLKVLCRPDTVVCVLQNGVEQGDRVGPSSPSPHIVPAVVWFPAQTTANGSVRLRGETRLTLPDSADSRSVAEALRDTRCDVELARDFTSLAWRKLLQNAAAGLMALTHRRAGMFHRADAARLSLDYLRECLAVARAEGATLGDDVPQEILAKFRAFPSDMGTSILTDREAGRPLEWDIRNGVISRRGRVHDIPTPISDMVVTLLAAASDGPG